MLVPEHLKVVAHPEQVEELLVDKLEFGLALSVIRLQDLEAQLHGLTHSNRCRSGRQADLVLGWHGQAEDELHPATVADSCAPGPDIGVHRADERKRFEGREVQLQALDNALSEQGSPGQQGQSQ